MYKLYHFGHIKRENLSLILYIFKYQTILDGVKFNNKQLKLGFDYGNY